MDVIEEEAIEFARADAVTRGVEVNPFIANMQHITRAAIFGLSAVGKFIARENSTLDMVTDAGLDSEIVLLEKSIRDGIKGALVQSAQAKKNPRMKLIEGRTETQRPPAPQITIHTL